KSEHWIFTQPDWDEFWQVIRGNGPCNRERLKARRKAHEDGDWVRAAATAYAAKHATDPASATA
ncbi:MAG: 1,2-phenylacetyl-CoA epoxidase subunit A, partial [Acidobacteriota bacterium]|nr:1,2-phenylacetyl-CoA epoxidase subunit A [Acidobacteriota bacterium]